MITQSKKFANGTKSQNKIKIKLYVNFLFILSFVYFKQSGIVKMFDNNLKQMIAVC